MRWLSDNPQILGSASCQVRSLDVKFLTKGCGRTPIYKEIATPVLVTQNEHSDSAGRSFFWNRMELNCETEMGTVHMQEQFP